MKFILIGLFTEKTSIEPKANIYNYIDLSQIFQNIKLLIIKINCFSMVLGIHRYLP